MDEHVGKDLSVQIQVRGEAAHLLQLYATAQNTKVATIGRACLIKGMIEFGLLPPAFEIRI